MFRETAERMEAVNRLERMKPRSRNRHPIMSDLLPTLENLTNIPSTGQEKDFSEAAKA
jgi:hypothetical protein